MNKRKKNLICAYEGGEDFEFEDFLYNIEQLIKKAKKFFVTGSNMGWRHLTGYAVVETNDAQEFINKTMPQNTQLSIEVFKSDLEGAICEMTVYHHDAPTGEGRVVYAYSTAKKLGLIPQGN